MSLVTGLFSLVHLLLNQRRSPLLRLQVSDCSTFRIMCDVPGRAVFCTESTDCFLVTASKRFFKRFVTISSGSNYYRSITTFHIPNSTYLDTNYYYYYYYYYYYMRIWHSYIECPAERGTRSHTVGNRPKLH
jgi:hypothetical protein